MDEKNERAVMSQIFSSSESGSQSQYFLLTPKLLSNLDLNNHVTVHVIFNG